MKNQVKTTRNKLGFHYYQDTDHYAGSDLQKWLPELTAMGVAWLVLKAPKNRAIPEAFITSLVDNKIEPVLQFDLPLSDPPNPAELSSLLTAYANWGVHAVQFHDKPNCHASWKSSQWALLDVVEQFLDRFIPYASLALKNGLVPVFPTPEPGGNYWDTAFLRSALESLARRKQDLILQTMILSAYAWDGGHCLNWGAGGPDRWPLAKPYTNDSGTEDHLGFRIFDWYNAISKAVTGKVYPMILFQSGYCSASHAESEAEIPEEQINQAIVNLIQQRETPDPHHPEELLQPIPSNIIASCFWMLADDNSDEPNMSAWFRGDGSESPLVSELKEANRQSPVAQATIQPETAPLAAEGSAEVDTVDLPDPVAKDAPHPIEHYLLLPTYDWGIAEWHLDVIRPFIKKHRPTIGFSIEEAALAQKVTVIGSTKVISEDELDVLRNAGAMVERINGDGISIATKLAER